MTQNSPQDVKAKKRRLTLTDAALELVEALDESGAHSAAVDAAIAQLRREVNKSLERQLRRNSDIVFLNSLFVEPKIKIYAS